MTKSFNTLVKENKHTSAERWYPQPVEKYKNSIKIDTSIENSKALRSNFSYNFQYIEFLEKEISELDLSSVLYTMLVKTYVITGMSLIEGLFTNIIKSNGWWKMSNLESLGKTQANETKFDTEKLIVTTELFRQVDKYPLQMNLDDMIKILDKHHDALSIDHLKYPALKRLKELRNKIHLQKSNCDTDHDYNAFNLIIKREMGEILYAIFTSPKTCNDVSTFDFLKINIE